MYRMSTKENYTGVRITFLSSLMLSPDNIPITNWFSVSELDFTRTLDLSQSQNPRFSIAKLLVLFNRKIEISGKRLSSTVR